MRKSIKYKLSVPCLVLVFLLMGCSKGNVEGTHNSQETETQETETQQPTESKTETQAPTESETEPETQEPTESEPETQEPNTQEPNTQEPHVHNHMETVVAATCTKDGAKTYTCSCGDVYSEVIKAIGHKFGEYSYNNDATYTKDGTQTAKCSVCGKKDTVIASGTKLSYTIIELDKTMWTTSSVTVRDLPSKDGKKIGSFNEKDEVKVTGQCKETNWYRVEYNGKVGYVSASYLSNNAPQPNMEERLAKYLVDGEIVVNMDKHKDLYIKNYDNLDEYRVATKLYDYVKIGEIISVDGYDPYAEYIVGTIQYSSDTSLEELWKVYGWFSDMAFEKQKAQHPEYSGAKWSGINKLGSEEEFEQKIQDKESFSVTYLCNIFVYEGDLFDYVIVFSDYRYTTVHFEYIE